MRDMQMDITISIHAPTRGATLVLALFGVLIHISIHAPTRGATSGTVAEGDVIPNFNPRSYKRSDVFGVL